MGYEKATVPIWQRVGRRSGEDDRQPAVFPRPWRRFDDDLHVASKLDQTVHQAALGNTEHLLHVKVEAHRLVPPTLDLSVLRLGFDVPQAQADGFTVLQVKTITLLSPDTQLKLDCTAMASSEHRCVTDLLAEKLPGPLAQNWLITAAQINLYYPPAPGKTRPKVVTIEVTRKGRLNLHKFDAALQSQLEGYLVSLGILQKGQTLNAQEAPPAADAPEPALEH